MQCVDLMLWNFIFAGVNYINLEMQNFGYHLMELDLFFNMPDCWFMVLPVYSLIFNKCKRGMIILLNYDIVMTFPQQDFKYVTPWVEARDPAWEPFSSPRSERSIQTG